VKGKTQDWPAAGPEDTVHVEGAAVVVVVVVVVVLVLPEQVRVLQTYWPLELHTQVLQSTVVNVPGVQLVDTWVVVVVTVVVVVVVVVVVEVVVVVVVVVALEVVSAGQVDGQKPYSPSIWVPALVVDVEHQGAASPTEVQAV